MWCTGYSEVAVVAGKYEWKGYGKPIDERGCVRDMTVYKDFDGTVELKLKRKKRNRKYEGLNDYDDSVQVVGKGNINFLAGQTGI